MITISEPTICANCQITTSPSWEISEIESKNEQGELVITEEINCKECYLIMKWTRQRRKTTTATSNDYTVQKEKVRSDAFAAPKRARDGSDKEDEEENDDLPLAQQQRHSAKRQKTDTHVDSHSVILISDSESESETNPAQLQYCTNCYAIQSYLWYHTRTPTPLCKSCYSYKHRKGHAKPVDSELLIRNKSIWKQWMKNQSTGSGVREEEADDQEEQEEEEYAKLSCTVCESTDSPNGWYNVSKGHRTCKRCYDKERNWKRKRGLLNPQPAKPAKPAHNINSLPVGTSCQTCNTTILKRWYDIPEGYPRDFLYNSDSDHQYLCDNCYRYYRLWKKIRPIALILSQGMKKTKLESQKYLNGLPTSTQQYLLSVQWPRLNVANLTQERMEELLGVGEEQSIEQLGEEEGHTEQDQWEEEEYQEETNQVIKKKLSAPANTPCQCCGEINCRRWYYLPATFPTEYIKFPNNSRKERKYTCENCYRYHYENRRVRPLVFILAARQNKSISAMRKEMKHWDYPKRKKCCYEQWPGLKQLVIKRGRKLSHKKINQILGVPPYFSDSDDAEKQDEEVEVMDISEPEVEIQAESDSEVHSESDLSDIDDTFTAGVLQDCLLEITTGPSVSGADTAQMASQSVVSVPSVQAQTIPPLQEPQPTDVESDGGRTPEFKPQSESAYDVESKPQAQELPIVTATPSPSRSNTSPAPISSTQPQSVLKKHPHHKRVRFSMEVQERYINPFSTMAQTEPYHGDAENGNGPVISPPQPHQMPEIKDNESVDVQINATEQSSQDPRPENTTLIPQHPARIKELQQKSKQIISPTKTFHSLVRRQSVKPNKNTPAVAPPAPIPAPVKNDTSAKIPIMTFRRNVVPTAQTSGVLTDGGNSSSSGTVTSTNNKTHSNRQIELLSTLLMANKSKLQNFVEDLLIEPSIPNSSSEIDTIPELRSLLILKSHTTQSLLKEPKEEWYRDRSGMSIDEVRWRNSQNSKQLASVLLKYLMEEE